jgi:2-methylcitrate dehydratase PrpD
MSAAVKAEDALRVYSSRQGQRPLSLLRRQERFSSASFRTLGSFSPRSCAFARGHRLSQELNRFFTAQGAVDAAIKRRERIRPEGVKSLAVESYRCLIGRGATDPEKWAPKSRETADHSVPFCVAAALLDGAVTAHTLNIREIFPLLAIS